MLLTGGGRVINRSKNLSWKKSIACLLLHRLGRTCEMARDKGTFFCLVRKHFRPSFLNTSSTFVYVFLALNYYAFVNLNECYTFERPIWKIAVAAVSLWRIYQKIDRACSLTFILLHATLLSLVFYIWNRFNPLANCK